MAIEPTIDIELVPEISPEAPVVKDYIQRSIDALDDIREAIEYHDIEVPDPTPIEEYEELIKLIKGFDINNYPWTPFEGIVQSDLIDGDPIYGYMESNWDEAFDSFVHIIDKPLEGANTVEWSHDKRYLIIGRNDSPSMLLFNVNGETLSEFNLPDDLPQNPIRKLLWSKDDKYILAWLGDYSFRLYKFQDEIMTIVTNDTGVNTDSGINTIVWHISGDYVLIGSSTAPYLFIYKFNIPAERFELLSSQGLITDSVLQIEFRPLGDIVYIYVNAASQNNVSPQQTGMYLFTNGILNGNTKRNLPLPPGNYADLGYYINFLENQFSSAGFYARLISGSNNSGLYTMFIEFYRVLGTANLQFMNAFELAQPFNQSFYNISWSQDGLYLGASGDYGQSIGSSQIFIYKYNGTEFIDLNIQIPQEITNSKTTYHFSWNKSGTKIFLGQIARYYGSTSTLSYVFDFNKTNNILENMVSISNSQVIESVEWYDDNTLLTIYKTTGSTYRNSIFNAYTVNSDNTLTLKYTTTMDISIYDLSNLPSDLHYYIYNNSFVSCSYQDRSESEFEVGRTRLYRYNGTSLLTVQTFDYRIDKMVFTHDNKYVYTGMFYSISSNYQLSLLQFNSNYISYPQSSLSIYMDFSYDNKFVIGYDCALIDFDTLSYFPQAAPGRGGTPRLNGYGYGSWISDVLFLMNDASYSGSYSGAGGPRAFGYNNFFFTYNMAGNNVYPSINSSELWFDGKYAFDTSNYNFNIVTYTIDRDVFSITGIKDTTINIGGISDHSMSYDGYLAMIGTSQSLVIYKAISLSKNIEEYGKIMNLSTYPIVSDSSFTMKYKMSRTMNATYTLIDGDTAYLSNSQSIRPINYLYDNVSFGEVGGSGIRYAISFGGDTTANGASTLRMLSVNHQENIGKPTLDFQPGFAIFGNDSGYSGWPGIGVRQTENANLYNAPSPISSWQSINGRIQFTYIDYQVRLSVSNNIDMVNELAYIKFRHPNGTLTRRLYSASSYHTKEYISLMPTPSNVTLDSTDIIWAGGADGGNYTDNPIQWNNMAIYQNGRYIMYCAILDVNTNNLRFENTGITLPYFAYYYGESTAVARLDGNIILTNDTLYRFRSNPVPPDPSSVNPILTKYALSTLRKFTLPNASSVTKISYNGEYAVFCYSVAPYIELYRLTIDDFTKIPISDYGTGNANILAEVGVESLLIKNSNTVYTKRILPYRYKFTSGGRFQLSLSLAPFYNEETFDIFAWSLDRRVCVIDNWANNSHQISVFTLDASYKLSFQYNIPLPAAPINFAWSDNNEYLIILFEVEPYIQIYKYNAQSIQFTLTNFAMENPIQSKKAYWAHNNRYFALVNNEMTVYKLDINTFIKLTPPENLPFIDMADLSWAYNSRFISTLDIRLNKMYIYRLLNDELSLISEV